MILTINGKKQEINAQTAFEVRKQFFQIEDIIILNGFQISKDYLLKENDMLSIIPKGKMPKQEELESMMAARHTPQIHKKIKKAKVAIAGLGGLGSNIAVMLARIGVGYLRLIDFDIVEPSNLNRQCYFMKHLGLPKTTALKEILEEINPFIEIETKKEEVTKENIKDLFYDVSIVCEAFDKADTKAMLVDTMSTQFPDTLLVCGCGMAGFESSNLIQTKQITKNIYICGDFKSEAKIGNGLMAPRVAICAGHQANMVLRLIVGETMV